jgi:hypothetical protein
MSNSQWGLAQAHLEVVDAVRTVAEQTESPILTAGQTVSMVVERAQSTLEEAKSLTGKDKGGHSQMAQLLLSQGEATRRYLQVFTGCLKEVAGVTTRATSLLGTIGSGASTFAQLVRTGDFLSLYAKMELARLPPGISESSSFSQEFKALTKGIRELSERIGVLAEAMSSTLPEIDRLVRELAVESRRVASQVESQGIHTRELADALDRSLNVLSRLGEEHLPAIVDRAQKALSSLQFYDPLMQDIQSLDGLMAELRTSADPAGREIEPLHFLRRLGDIKEEKPSGQVAPGDSQVADAGEVMLF